MFRFAFVVLVGALAVGCEDQKEWTEFPHALAGGTYHLAYGVGLTADEETSLTGLTAHLDRANGTFTLVLPGEPEQVLTFSPRPRDQWMGDCVTMGGYSVNEVADLGPGPLQLGAVTFETPLIHTKCSQLRMVLASTYDGYVGGASRGLAFDLD